MNSRRGLRQCLARSKVRSVTCVTYGTIQTLLAFISESGLGTKDRGRSDSRGIEVVPILLLIFGLHEQLASNPQNRPRIGPRLS